MKKNVLFLCCSRYVILIAYIIKKLLGSKNRYILMISDTIGNENGITEYISKLGMWDDVEIIHEKGLSYKDIKESIDTYLKTHRIDIFFVSHIMRYSSHYFLQALSDTVEVNLFDEGIISLDLLNGYKYWRRKGLPVGWPEFDFNRVDNFYVLYPDITESVGRANIKGIDLEHVLKNNLKEFVQELNILFDYKYEPLEKEVIVIDADIAVQGSITQTYENHCVKNVMRELDAENSIIKIKPSVSQALIDEKYGRYSVEFMGNSLVPFEVMYLNYIIHNQLPKVFVAFPTTLIWNLILINQKLNIASCKMVSVANIMKDYYFVPGNAEDMMHRVRQYQSCFGEKYKVELPKTWSEYRQCIQMERLSKEEIESIEWEEREWILSEYKAILNRPINSSIVDKYRSKIFYKWINAIYSGRSIADYLKKKKIDRVVLYGNGEFANLILKELEKASVSVYAVLKTTIDKQEFFAGTVVREARKYLTEEYKKQIPIILTAVGREKELIQVIDSIKSGVWSIKIEEILDDL